MNKNRYFTCTSVQFYAPIDEDIFFNWIKKISCIKSFEGAQNYLYLDLVERELDEHDLQEVAALFYRYSIDMKQLQPYINENNKHTVIRWQKEIFG